MGKGYLIPCPNCKVIIPRDIKTCWGCGVILDPHLRKLTGASLKQTRKGRRKKKR